MLQWKQWRKNAVTSDLGTTLRLLTSRMLILCDTSYPAMPFHDSVLSRMANMQKLVLVIDTRT